MYVDEEHGTVTFETTVEGAWIGEVRELGDLVVELIKVGTGRVGLRPSAGIETSDIVVKRIEEGIVSFIQMIDRQLHYITVLAGKYTRSALGPDRDRERIYKQKPTHREIGLCWHTNQGLYPLYMDNSTKRVRSNDRDLTLVGRNKECLENGSYR